MTLPVMPSTHTWVQGGPILARAGQAAIYAADSSQMWVWNEDTGLQVSDLRDANGNTISTVPVVNGRVDGVGVPVAVQLASFSIGQNGPRFFVLPVQTIRNAASGGTANDTTVAGFVNTSGTATRTALDGRYILMGQFDPRRYGTVDISGTNDSSTAVLAAIADWQTTGGEMTWPGGTIRIDSQIALTYDTDAQPKQKSGVWRGRGATFNGTSTSAAAGATPPNGGTVLDLRYSGSTGAGSKIDTRGLGLLEVTGITFTDRGTSSTPFIQTTNTTLQIHNCAFIGNPSKSLTTCDQDAIILGGTNTGLPVNNAAQSPFQGYGTVIRDNYFARIRRGVLVQTYGNSITINANTWWANCGSNLAGGAAIEFAPTGSNFCVGNSVTDNLIECTGYVYGITADWTTNSWFAANHCWDYGSGTVAAYHFGDHGVYNTVVAGAYTDSKPLVEETPTSYNTNTVINGHQAMRSMFPQIVQFTYSTPPMAFNGFGYGFTTVGAAGDLSYLGVNAQTFPYPEAQVNTVAHTQVTDGVTTSGSKVITSATAPWAITDVGMPVSGTGIPGSTVIQSYQSATQVTLSKAATATATGVTLSFGKGVLTSPVLQVGFNRQHIISKGAIGTAGAYAAAGTGATCTASGTDTAFTVTLVTGTSPTSGQQCFLPFGTSWAVAPKVSLTPKNAAAASAMSSAGIYLTNTNANAFITTVNALPASTTFIFDVLAVQ